MELLCSIGEEDQISKTLPKSAAMKYDHDNEPVVWEAYTVKLQTEHHSGVVVTRTRFSHRSPGIYYGLLICRGYIYNTYNSAHLHKYSKSMIRPNCYHNMNNHA